METEIYKKIEKSFLAGISKINLFYDILTFIAEIRYTISPLSESSKFQQKTLSVIDNSIFQFYKTWSKFSMLGVPEDRYMNIIEKILEYTQMIIDQKGVDYQTLPGMKEFVELVDQQFEEIVSKDPKLDALRKDPYGL